MGALGAVVSAFREPDEFAALEQRIGALEGRLNGALAEIKKAERDERARRPLSSRTTFLFACLLGGTAAAAGTFGLGPFGIFFGVAGAVAGGIASFKWYLELEEP